LVRSLTVQVVAPVVVQVWPPLPDAATVYEAIVLSLVPVSAGAVHRTVADALPAVAEIAVGAVGPPVAVVHHGEKVASAVTGEPAPPGLVLAL
jgi:hypothetical protein